MKLTNTEKLTITNKDELRRRHKGNYQPVTNGEIYLLPYEVLLRTKPDSFFSSLSNYDFLKASSKVSQLSLKELRQELWVLNDDKNNQDFWKNFNDSALKSHLNTILDTKCDKDWRKTYLKQNKEKDTDKVHHDDMLKCLYLLAHLHKASPTFIRQLAIVNDAWSTDLRIFYPRKDFVFSEEYSGFLAELYINILYYQPESIRKVVKYLDVLIDKMVKYPDGMFADILDKRSEDTDSPSLKILKYYQIGTITHFQALQHLLSDKIMGDFYDNSFSRLNSYPHSKVANAKHYWLVAAQCLKLKWQGPMEKKGHDWYFNNHEVISQNNVDKLIKLYANALAEDALNGLKFESTGSKSGKKDTSLPAAIRQMAEQNPQSIDEILKSIALNFANIPEIYTKYVYHRVQYAENYSSKTHIELIENMKCNPVIERVLGYIRGNNLAQIHTDIDMIEQRIKLINYMYGNIDDIENVPIVFEYGIHELPSRE